ncbi:MAG TPA: restriction endonuclease subunit S [Vicinamibacterales bacterium]
MPLKKLAVDMQPGFASQPTTSDLGVPQLRTNNVSAEGRLDLSELKYVPALPSDIERYSLMAGDILFNNTNSPALVGKTAFFRESGQFLFSNHMTRIRIDQALAEPRYVARFLHWTWSQGAFRPFVTQWVNQAAINRAQLAAVPVPLPALSEQRHIVEILDQADCLRCLRAGADAKAESILPAIFFKMFGDPVTNPKGWRESPIDRVADVQGGLQLSEKRKGNIDVPYLRVANVYRNRLDLSEIKTLSVTQPELDRTRLTAGDVLVVEGHGNPAEIGRCAVWDGSIDPCVHQNHLIRARPNPSRLRPYFLSRFLNSAAGRQHLLRCGKTTSGLNTITVSNVKSAVIFLPPVDLQQRFEEGVACEDTTCKLRNVASAALERLWNLLLDRAFSGSLTARWRESHMKELLTEMEHQSRALAEVR